MGKWLDNFKDRVSDWYYDGDQFYLRTVVDPVVDIVKGIGSLGQAASETFTPVYSDIIAANNLFSNGLSDFKSGKYLKGSTEMIGAPLLGATLMAVPDGIDSPIKAATKLDEPLYVFTGKQMGQKAGRGRPASNINEATGQPITMRDVLDAMKNNGRTVYENTTEEAIESMAKRQAIDKEAGYHAIVQAQDRKLARQKDPSEMTKMNVTDKRQGISQDKSGFPKVTTYLQEILASGFTPSKKARIKGDVDLAYQEWIDYLQKLKYDTKSKDSVKAINQIAEETWMKLFQPKKKQGGILNYLTLFS